jgi:hypothetical protein
MTAASSSSVVGAADVDFVSLYYRGEAMSLDEDEFSEFAASCAAGCKRALSGANNDDLHHALLIDRHAVVQGVYMSFDALVRELDPLSRAPPVVRGRAADLRRFWLLNRIWHLHCFKRQFIHW